MSQAIGEIAQGAQTQVESVQQARAAAAEVGRAIADISHGAEEQVRAVALVSSTVREVAEAVETASSTARSTAAAAHDTREVAREGVSAAEHASEAMSSVRDSSREVNSVIDELAAKSKTASSDACVQKLSNALIGGFGRPPKNRKRLAFAGLSCDGHGWFRTTDLSRVKSLWPSSDCFEVSPEYAYLQVKQAVDAKLCSIDLAVYFNLMLPKCFQPGRSL